MVNLVEKTAEMVKHKLMGESSGHDWWHTYRVWKLAKNISKSENVNIEIVELGALLHDIADYKLNDGDEKIGGKVTREWLKNLNANKDLINSVVHIVDNVSFIGGGKNKIKSLEGQIVQDADRLDAVGAIGIARCFAYGGNKGREIYNPNIRPKLNMTKEEYKNNRGSSINHFYEKLLLLKDLMNTDTGRKIAVKRHQFMKRYLNEFFTEWKGEK